MHNGYVGVQQDADYGSLFLQQGDIAACLFFGVGGVAIISLVKAFKCLQMTALLMVMMKNIFP